MRVTVLLFAAYREMAGTGRVPLELPDGSTADDAWQAVATRFPAVVPLRAATSIAVNRTIVVSDHELRDGDEVALLQPVSGGRM